MTEYINHGSLKVSKELDDLINKKVCIGIDLEPENFWASFEKIIEEAFQKADRDQSGSVSFEEFIIWARSNRDIMVNTSNHMK